MTAVHHTALVYGACPDDVRTVQVVGHVAVVEGTLLSLDAVSVRAEAIDQREALPKRASS